MRADIVPGALFPDYALPDHRGKHRTLSEHLLRQSTRTPLRASTLNPGFRILEH